MPKISFMKNSDSAHSIDISKPEGLSSFWNLFSKNNKKSVQILNNEGSFKSNKMNSIALKILKLKGIDINNLDNFANGDFQTLKQNNGVVIIQPNKSNLKDGNFAKGNILCNLLNSKTMDDSLRRDDKATNDISENVSVPKKKFQIKSDKIPIQLVSKKAEVNHVLNQNIVRAKDKYTNSSTTDLSSLSKSFMLKSVPKSKLEKSNRKRIIVPVYVGKKSSKKSDNSEKEANVNLSGNDESVDVQTLLSKIKTLEEQLNVMGRKSKEDKESPPFQPSLKTPSISNMKVKQFKPEVDNFITNRAKRNMFTISKVQSTQNNKMGKVSQKHKPIKRQTILSSSQDCNIKEKEKTEEITGTLIDILNNPDILIKNHNLKIPRNVSQESLFRANPYAGCDTILKLFGALSKKSDNSNQKIKTSNRDRSRNIQEGSKVSDSGKVNKENTLSHAVGEPHVETVYESTVSKNNVSEINFPLNPRGKNSRKRNNNELRSIFSLPVNLNILKSLENEKSYEDNKLSEKTDSKANLITKSRSNIEEKSVYVDTSKNEDTTKRDQPSIQQAGRKTEQVVVSEKQAKVESKESEHESLLEDKLEKDGVVRTKSCESNLKNNTSGHRFRGSSSAVQLKVTDRVCNNSDGESKCNINMFHLNISNEQSERTASLARPQKPLKKTTIACPVNMTDQNLKITIVIETNLSEGENILEKVNHNVDSPLFPQHREIENPSSTDTLKHVSSGIEERFDGKIVDFTDQKSSEFGSKFINSTEPTTLSESKVTFNINQGRPTGCENSISKDNDLEQSVKLELGRKNTYLTEAQRRVFDKEVLRVDNCEKSINFSNFKFDRQHTSYINSMFGSGLINIWTSSSTSETKNQLTTHFYRKISQRPKSGRRTLRNQFYKENFSVKKQSKTTSSQTENSFVKKTSIVEENLPSEEKNLQCVPINEERPATNENTLSEAQPNNSLNKSCSCENSDSVNVKKRTCRSNVTLNKESILRQAENKFIHLKNISDRDGVATENKIMSTEGNQNQSAINGLNVMAGGQSCGLELKCSKDFHQVYSPIKKIGLDQTVEFVNSDLENSKDNFDLHGTKLGAIPKKANSTISEERRKKMTLFMKNKIQSNHLETQSLKRYQYRSINLYNESGTVYRPKHECSTMQQSKLPPEDMLCPDVLLNRLESLEEIGIENEFGGSVKDDPYLVCHPSSQSLLNGTIYDVFQNENNNEMKLYHFCTCGCLAVTSESDFTNSFVE